MHSISENSVEKKLNLALESLQQQQEQMKEFATRSSVDELARRVQEECRNAHIGAVHDMQVILENTVMKQLKLLAEGQQTLLETLAPRSKVEDLEGRRRHAEAGRPHDVTGHRRAEKSPINARPRAALLCGIFAFPYMQCEAETHSSQKHTPCHCLPICYNVSRMNSCLCAEERRPCRAQFFQTDLPARRGRLAWHPAANHLCAGRDELAARIPPLALALQ